MNSTTIITYTGKQLDLSNPKPSQICIEDIAHALSQICRFAGNTNKFYSVAEHSCFVSDCVLQKYKFSALLHDATETYISDIPTPLKKLIPEISVVEKKIAGVIARKFGAPHMESVPVKMMDSRMFYVELHTLLQTNKTIFCFPIQNWSPEKAKEEFLKRFNKLNPISEYARNLK